MMTPKMTREEAIARPTAQPPVGASKFLGSEPMEIDAGKGLPARPMEPRHQADVGAKTLEPAYRANPSEPSGPSKYDLRRGGSGQTIQYPL